MQYKVSMYASDHKRLKHHAVDQESKLRELQLRASELLVAEAEAEGMQQLKERYPVGQDQKTLINWAVDGWTWAVMREHRQEAQMSVAEQLHIAVELVIAESEETEQLPIRAHVFDGNTEQFTQPVKGLA